MTIRYDDERVKRPLAEHEYTNEQILELEKCSKDIYEFIKHVKIITTDGGETPFEPYVYQDKLLNVILDNRFTCSLQFRQSGKCVHPETTIIIRNKKTGNIEDISIGDFFNKVKK
jgi:hypothetical protein